MKTAELIKRLQDIDPSGEEQCCIQNGDIWFIEKTEAYYDGRLQVFEFDSARRPISAKRESSGSKIVLHPIHISDAIEYPDFKIIL
jgi:hypothetical protein